MVSRKLFLQHWYLIMSWQFCIFCMLYSVLFFPDYYIYIFRWQLWFNFFPTTQRVLFAEISNFYVGRTYLLIAWLLNIIGFWVQFYLVCFRIERMNQNHIFCSWKFFDTFVRPTYNAMISVMIMYRCNVFT